MTAEEVVVVRALSPTTTQASARKHTVTIDKPESSGGGDTAPMASEYLLAALGSCQITTAYRVAAKRGRKIDALSITVAGTLENGQFEKIRVVIEVKGDGEEADWKTVFRLVERTCTISRALSVPVEQELRVG